MVKAVENENKHKNVIQNVRDDKSKSFTNGASWLRSIEINAGEEVEILVEFNWWRKGVTKDWSVTAWGENGGEVSIRHSKGIQTKTFAYTPKDYATKSFDTF